MRQVPPTLQVLDKEVRFLLPRAVLDRAALMASEVATAKCGPRDRSALNNILASYSLMPGRTCQSMRMVRRTESCSDRKRAAVCLLCFSQS